MARTTARIDLHGMTKIDAEFALRNFINSLPSNIKTIEVIHGIGNGILKDMVATFYHHRIIDRALCIGNQGQTLFYL